MKKFITIIILLLIIIPFNVFAYNKSETIYNNLDYNGKVTKKVINSHLYNIDKESIEDYTILEDIMNLNGEEKYTYEGNKLTWENKGKDIYYKGTTKKENPIKFNIKYYLNNKEVNPSDITNKKGNIKIVINTKNNSYNNKYKVYNPFVITMGTVINNDNNSNISVTNGSVISTGSKSFIVGLSAPGLNDSINNSLLNGLDNITISYKTNKFSLKNIYFVATPKVLSKVDIDKLNKLETLSNSVGLLKTGMDKIDESTKKLVEGSNKLVSGSNDLNNGLIKINESIDKIDTGAYTLSEGISYISYQVSELNKELSSKFTPEVIENLNKLLDTDKNLYNVREGYYKEYGFGYLSETSYDTLLLLKNNHIITEDEYNLLYTIKSTYEGNPSLVELGYNNYFAVNSLVELVDKLQLVNELDIGLNKVSTSMNDLSTGISLVNGGSSLLVEGSNKLNTGLIEFNKGASTLSDGISTLNNQGISKLYEYSNILNSYTSKIKNIVKASKEYNGYACSNANKTIFIYKVKSAK